METKRIQTLSEFVTAHRKRVVPLGLLVLLHGLLFGLTDPLDSPVLFIVAGFIVVSVDITLVAFVVVRGLSRLFPGIAKHAKRIALVLAGFSIVLLALSSIGQLTWRDVIAVTAIGAIAYFYSVYFRIGIRHQD